MTTPKHRPLRLCAPLALLAAMLVPPRALAAQGGDPTEEILEIARQVDKQLKEVDRLLLESSRPQGDRKKPKEMLEQSIEHNAEATAGIEDLIEKLTQMKNQSGGGGQNQDQNQDQQQQQQNQQNQDQQQQQQNQQQQGGRQNRRENETPDLVQQPPNQQGQQQEGQQQQQQQGQQPGQQQPQQPQDGDPQGGREQITDGQNRQGKAPPEGETGPGSQAQGEGSWGELQPYLNSLKNRGSEPKVPPKYRKYWEAYLKNKRAESKGK